MRPLGPERLFTCRKATGPEMELLVIIVLAVHKRSAIEVVELGALELGAELQGGEHKLVGGLALAGLQFGAQVGVGAEGLVQVGVAVPQAQQLVRCA